MSIKAVVLITNVIIKNGAIMVGAMIILKCQSNDILLNDIGLLPFVCDYNYIFEVISSTTVKIEIHISVFVNASITFRCSLTFSGLHYDVQ